MSVVLTQDEIHSLTGYKRPGDQLRELKRQGFFRAHRARGGKGPVVVERPHYEAVKTGNFVVSPVPFVDTSNIKPSTRGPAKPIDWDAKTALYRHFDKGGKLLYVGIAVDPEKREYSHRREAPWAHRIDRIEVEWFNTRHKAVEAERAAIAAEKPRFNVLHQRKEQPA